MLDVYHEGLYIDLEVTAMTFGENMRRLRLSRNMTQKDVAQSLDITRQAVARWETGANKPNTEKLLELAALFDVPVSELAGGKPESAEHSARRRIFDVTKVFAVYALLWVVCTLLEQTGGLAVPWADFHSIWLWCRRHMALPLCFLLSALALDSGFERTCVSVFAGLVSGLIFASVWDAAVFTGPARLGTGFVALIIIVALALATGIVLEFRGGTLAGNVFAERKRMRYALLALIIFLAVLSMYHITNRLSYISGANDGWQAGFDAGLSDAAAGNWHASYDSSTGGVSQYDLGWQFYYSEGYNTGYAFSE